MSRPVTDSGISTLASSNKVFTEVLLSIVVILLGQHCTGKNPVHCCLRDSRQHCEGIDPEQCRLNITSRQFLF